MKKLQNDQYLLLKRPASLPNADEVSRISSPVPALEQGQLLIENLYLSLDPAIRGWMSAEPSYLPPIELGSPVRSTTLGVVIESQHPDFTAGDHVVGLNAWERYSISDGFFLNKVLPNDEFPLHYHLSIFGAVGMTSYFGVSKAAQIRKPGETLLMSAAAGAVGSVGGQIAKLMDCRVVGIAGSDEKCRWIVDELGFDAAINYKQCGEITQAIAEHCPEGVDIYFDNVGGEILDAALMHFNHGARMVFCGAISAYNGNGKIPGPENWWQILAKAATVQGFLVSDYVEQWPSAIEKMQQWLREGQMQFREQIDHGFDQVLSSYTSLFDGSNKGKLIIDIRN